MTDVALVGEVAGSAFVGYGGGSQGGRARGRGGDAGSGARTLQKLATR